jgi:hypothetical protein
VIHHASIPDMDVEDHGGYRVTRPLRSLVDCAADHLEVDLLAGVIDDALRRHLLTADQLRAAGAARPTASHSRSPCRVRLIRAWMPTRARSCGTR